MTLAIYQKADPSTAFSLNGQFTNPLQLTFDGSDGGVSIQQLYVRNDGVGASSYTGIILSLADDAGGNYLNGTNGYTWKLIGNNGAPVTQPVMGQWDTVTPGNSIPLGNVSGTGIYLPFWLYVKVNPNTSVQSFQDVTLNLNATANV